MFLEMVQKRNPELIEYAILLHQKGIILPDTYVIDLDKVKENARKMLKKAKELDIELFYMLKQIGRNPLVARELVKVGIKKAVVVDFKEAAILMEHSLPIGNVGHLVQVPNSFLKKIMSYGVEYITVYSIEKLRQIELIAKELKIKQKVLLKIIDDKDAIYPGQYGGFQLDNLSKYIDEFKLLEGCILCGLTSFPCILYNSKNKKFESTPNVNTLFKAKHYLQENGFKIIEMNIPSATSFETLPLIKEIGGTQGEPGHALTGTSPKHAEVILEEIPAYVYVSEVSHNGLENSFIYGGGYYPRGHLKNVLIDTKSSQLESTVKDFPSNNIDYYLEIDSNQVIGSTAIMSFRTQMFVTRSHVAIVKGLNSGSPRLMGIYDSQGNKIKGR